MKDAGTVNPRLRELLETGQLDWGNSRHREMYLRAWVKGGVPRLGGSGEQHG